MKKIAVFTSGGDAPGMNAAIRAVVRTATNMNIEVMGIRRGYQGMIENDLIPLKSRSVGNIIQRGGTMLKTARSESFRTKEGRELAFENLKHHEIEGLIAIGGNGTFTGASVFLQEFDIPTIGIPGTIDNDLFGTDFTIGFDTAVNTAVEAIDKIRDTAHAHDRLFFIEVMGRSTGHIALNCAICGGAEGVLVPEMLGDYANLEEKLKKSMSLGKLFSIVIVAEGDESGGAIPIAQSIKKKFPEYEVKVSTLGHMQRGGNPSANDRILASRLGVASVQALLSGNKNKMAGIINQQITFTPFEEAITKGKEINDELIAILGILST